MCSTLFVVVVLLQLKKCENKIWCVQKISHQFRQRRGSEHFGFDNLRIGAPLSLFVSQLIFHFDITIANAVMMIASLKCAMLTHQHKSSQYVRAVRNPLMITHHVAHPSNPHPLEMVHQCHSLSIADRHSKKLISPSEKQNCLKWEISDQLKKKQNSFDIVSEKVAANGISIWPISLSTTSWNRSSLNLGIDASLEHVLESLHRLREVITNKFANFHDFVSASGGGPTAALRMCCPIECNERSVSSGHQIENVSARRLHSPLRCVKRTVSALLSRRLHSDQREAPMDFGRECDRCGLWLVEAD
jgi:hypothetical protein